MIKVINIFAAPGTGKSTTAAGLFNIMKLAGEHVELVTEFAKELTYDKAFQTLDNQFLVAAEQDNRIRRLVGRGVEWVITDSPLPIGLAYASEEYVEWLTPTIWDAFDRYENYCVLLHRDPSHPYESYGRTQSQAEAMVLDNVIDSIFAEAIETRPDRFSTEITMGRYAPHDIYKFITEASADE